MALIKLSTGEQLSKETEDIYREIWVLCRADGTIAGDNGATDGFIFRSKNRAIEWNKTDPPTCHTPIRLK